MKTAQEVHHASVSDVFSKCEGPGVEEYLSEYLKPFAKPLLIRESPSEGLMIGNTVCLNCGKPLDGFFGTFIWGIAHGEGRCSSCDWPARLYHYLKLPTGDEGRIVAMLQYHPDYVGKRKGGNHGTRSRA